MKREQKAEVIEAIAAEIGDAEAIYAADYRGLSVAQAAVLRASLREVDSSFRIVKNTLTLRAADKAGEEQVKELVEGPTAFAFVRGDPALAAKALDAFSRRENVLELRGGLLNGDLLDGDAVRRLARLPAREQLNAQLAGVVASPVTGLVRGLGALVSGLAIALGQIREQRGDEPAAATEPTPAAEPAEEQAEEPSGEEKQPEEPSGEASESADGEASEETETSEEEPKEE